ncbi:uncharacterized protein Dyak_GE28664 [Drosophila yakuba]|uniref:Uncharacterized protein n=1 Tax=Drosophila yakuba TaxID=7245 RepID=A0A0R1DMH6_DROYA|nr:uncharacterized protein Dyak_GE28664 [Drosophila yakuba]
MTKLGAASELQLELKANSGSSGSAASCASSSSANWITHQTAKEKQEPMPDRMLTLSAQGLLPSKPSQPAQSHIILHTGVGRESGGGKENAAVSREPLDTASAQAP